MRRRVDEPFDRGRRRGGHLHADVGIDVSNARQATIQSARDLYGADSAAEQAVTQAWTAMGVF